MISHICAFLTAVANAGSNVLNRKATQQEPRCFEFSPKLILDLLRRRVPRGRHQKTPAAPATQQTRRPSRNQPKSVPSVVFA
jgi:hypothetical protein